MKSLPLAFVSALLSLLLTMPASATEPHSGPHCPETKSPVGRMIDLDGYRLNLLERGRHHAGVTVVLIDGLGASLDEWEAVQRGVAQFAHVVAYDRAGLGRSDFEAPPRALDPMTRELRQLLGRADLAPPYLLVAHSLGGFFARRFAALYPEEVAGLVLVDAASESENLIPSAELLNKMLAKPCMSAGVKRETRATPDLIRQMRAAHEPLPEGLPLVVITGMKLDPTDGNPMNSWQGKLRHYIFQKEWVDAVDDAIQISTTGSGHPVHQQQPWLVIGAVRQLVEAIDGGKSISGVTAEPPGKE